jgi:hypothetical protein
MAQPKFTLYKCIKLKGGSWRYKRAAFYSNGKIKPNLCIVGGKDEEHPEGAYYLYHDRKWTLNLARGAVDLFSLLPTGRRRFSKRQMQDATYPRTPFHGT